MAWTTPKTNWVGTDTFSAADWLRIVGNTKYIADSVGIAYTPFTSVTDKQTLINATHRTNVTTMLDRLYVRLGASWNRGYVLPRVDYGSTWNSKDLNIIENMLLDMKKQLDGELDNNIYRYAGGELFCGDEISVGLL